MMHESELIKIIADCKASQNPEELQFVYYEVSQITPKVIVEIGSWKGFLLETFDRMFSPEVLIGMEKDQLVIDPEIDNQYLVLLADSNDPKSAELLQKELNGQKIDYLFIDGDHTYEAVKKDFELYASLVRDEGIVGLHDVALSGKNADGHEWESLGIQVNRFWNEITKLYDHKMFQGADSGSGTGLIYL